MQNPLRLFASPLAALMLFSAATLHTYIVWSILSDKHPVIWSLHNDTIHRKGKGADFFSVYHAARCLYEPEPHTLYNCPHDPKTPYSYSYRYLPAVACCLYPLRALSPWIAYALWVTLLEAVLILIVILIGNAISDLHTRLIAVILLLLNSPYFLELYMGQFTFLSTALYLIGVFLHIAPIFVAFAIVIKLFPLITLPAWLRQKWGLLLIFTCADIGIITNMPYTANHPRAMIEVYERNLYIHDRDILYFSGNYGLAAMIGLSLGAVGAEDAVKPIIWGIKYGVFLFSIGIVLFSKRSHIWAQACLLLLAHFLTYHQVWEHHYSAVMLIGVSMLTPPECIGYPRMLILIALVVMALPTPFGILDIEKNPQVWDPTLQWALWKKYAILLPKVAPLLMLYGVAVWYNLREGLLTLPEVWRQVRQAQALP